MCNCFSLVPSHVFVLYFLCSVFTCLAVQCTLFSIFPISKLLTFMWNSCAHLDQLRLTSSSIMAELWWVREKSEDFVLQKKSPGCILGSHMLAYQSAFSHLSVGATAAIFVASTIMGMGLSPAAFYNCSLGSMLELSFLYDLRPCGATCLRKCRSFVPMCGSLTVIFKNASSVSSFSSSDRLERNS